MKVAMGILALLATVAGVLVIPGVDDAVQGWLAPSFADSRLAQVTVPTGAGWVGLVIGALVAVIGIGIAYRVYVQQVGLALRIRERVGPLHAFLVNKWYFDELIDFAVVRPAAWLGHFAGAVLERIVIGGAITGGATGVVRAGSAIVRRAQTGMVRYYAATMVVFITGVAAYFLVSAK
jgi:NADH-quinone oxidoreductase subunit L